MSMSDEVSKAQKRKTPAVEALYKFLSECDDPNVSVEDFHEAVRNGVSIQGIHRFLERKGLRRVGLTTLRHVATDLKSGIAPYEYE